MMSARPILFRLHAIQRMFERRVSEAQVRKILQSGEMIEDYSDEMGAPGGLVLGWRGQRPIHIVTAESSTSHEQVVVTVYEPDPAQWKTGFKDRRK